jgi:hypothetical protein
MTVKSPPVRMYGTGTYLLTVQLLPTVMRHRGGDK